jgi:hypothetical protein
MASSIVPGHIIATFVAGTPEELRAVFRRDNEMAGMKFQSRPEPDAFLAIVDPAQTGHWLSILRRAPDIASADRYVGELPSH